ncbi:MAG: hypothetical protein RLZ32_2795 [Gemmatimonadota bacterium]|jgi:hypothetical protein
MTQSDAPRHVIVGGGQVGGAPYGDGVPGGRRMTDAA